MGLANLLTSFVFIAIVSAKPLENAPTIFQAMMSDTETCSSMRDFLNSTIFVGSNCNFAVTGAPTRSMDELICFGIYDMALKLCHVASRNNVNLSMAKDTHALVAKEMKETKVNNDISSGKYCKDIVERINHPINKTLQYVTELREKFVKSCKHDCSSEIDNDTANPLCVILHMMVAADVIKPHPLSGEQVDITNVNNPEKHPNLQVEDKKPTEKQKADVKLKPKKDEVLSQSTVEPVNLPEVNAEAGKVEAGKVEAGKESAKMPLPKKVVEGGKVVPVTQAGTKLKHNEKVPPKEPVDKQKVTEVTSEVTKKTKGPDNTGAAVESDNVGRGSYEGNSKKDGEKDKTDKQKKVETEMVEEEIPKFEDNEKKSDDNRLSIDKPELGDEDYGGIKIDGDDDDTHTKDENEKNDQGHLAPVYQGDEVDADGSHAFLYFTMLSLGCVILYVMYLSKQKILATIVRLRRSRNRGRRRPSTANYRKLDCTLEEAVTSQCNANVTHVIY